MIELTDSEMGVIIDSLAMTRDHIRGLGLETPTIDSALKKVVSIVTPSTTRFELEAL